MILLMENGQPLQFDRKAASEYMKEKAATDASMAEDAMQESAAPEAIATNMSNDLSVDRSTVKKQRVDNPVVISVTLGNGSSSGIAWGCDLSYDYVKINAEYTT
ncbi:MAG: bifunctional ornithine acetyltransferase/N-acetylglutamate synthase [Microcoleus sp. SIO2G3]|nr:bifunctional ornithine acetyltransferase/N-acetylglutamate synthase [Microcoleus sp. SIO2G3]